jgi:ATP-binding cassette subfamily C protein LapB
MTNNIANINEVKKNQIGQAPNNIEEGSNGSEQANSALPTVLSKFAALIGHAVPAFRFSMLQHNQDGVEISRLSRLDQVYAMWNARFPSGDIRILKHDEIERGSFPLIWVSTNGNDVRLVRGRSSSGAFSCEDEKSYLSDLLTDVVADGYLVSLRADESSLDSKVKGPQTAADWFAFAIRKYRHIFFEAIFATFVLSTIGLVSALYTMQVYDRVLPSKGYSTLYVLTVGVLIAVVLEFVMRQVRAHMVEKASKAIDLELSAVFFGKALDIRMDARPPTVGTFASQIRHFESVRNFMTSSTLFILADAPFAILFIAVMAMIAGVVALVPVVMVPIALISGFAFQRSIERLTSENMTESNRKNGLLIEAIDGIESVKAAGGEWKMLDRYRELTSTIAGSELKLKELSTRTSNLAQSIQQINYVGMIAVGAYAITNGDLTMGGLVACSIISGRALSPLAQIPNLVVQWKHAKIALKSLDAIMAMPSDRSPGQRLVVPSKCDGALRVSNAVYAYREDKPALEIADLKFMPGERVAILGSVGSGKTTLIKMLSGLFKPKSGAVYLDDVDVDQLAPEYVREHVGYLPQDVRLFNGSLRDNLTMGLPTPSDGVILRVAKLTGLDQVILGQPSGLELQIAEGGRGLSGGQRQLVGLTRLLMAQPKIMLLDEPTASMDAQLESRVMKHLFEEISSKSLVVVVTHKVGVLAHVNRIVVVDKGRIAIDGPRDKVLEHLRQLQNPEKSTSKASVSEDGVMV